VREAFFIVGGFSVVVGVALMSIPAGLVCLGLVVVAVAALSE
jgi:hypothetical protein